MTPTLIATPGAANANSYATVAEADAYHARRLHTDDWPAKIAATATLGSGEDGLVTITAVTAEGVLGNAYAVVAALAGTPNAPLSVSFVDALLTVTLGTDGAGAADASKNTAALVANAIDALADVNAVASGEGTGVIGVTAERAFTGGDDRDDIKIPALLQATQLFDAHFVWDESWPTFSTQRLTVPRSGLVTRNEQPIAVDVVPDELKDAIAEFARQLIAEDRAEDNAVATLGLRSLKAGPVDMTFRDDVTPKVIPDAVRNLIPHGWGYFRSARPMMRELVRG